MTRSGATVVTGSLTVAAVSPGLYAENANGAGVAAALAERVSASGEVTPLSHRRRVCVPVWNGDSRRGTVQV
jgi:hypothetical protein